MKTLSFTALISMLFLEFTTFDDSSTKSIVAKSIATNTCTSNQEVLYSDIPRYTGDKTAQHKTSPRDGSHYEWTIEFADEYRGLLFQGGNSSNYFIEDPIGKNYFFINKLAAIRALYIYKKYNCISSKDRLQ